MIRGWGVRWYAVPSITIEEKLTTRRSRWRNEIHIQHQLFAQNILKRDQTLKQEKGQCYDLRGDTKTARAVEL